MLIGSVGQTLCGSTCSFLNASLCDGSVTHRATHNIKCIIFFEASNALKYLHFSFFHTGCVVISTHHHKYDGWQPLLVYCASFIQKMYSTLSADGDRACQDPFPAFHGGSWTDPLTRMSSYNMDRWNGFRLPKVECVLWAFVSHWYNLGLISSLTGTNNSLCEKLQGLINNNAVIHYILISKLIPAER